MSTFHEVNDAMLIDLIGQAVRRIVFVAPGVHQPVADALGRRFKEVDHLDITVVIDPDEDVYRVGYGDEEGLKLLNSHAQQQGFALMAQPGLRVGVLLVDGKTLVWSPTPRSVEAAPGSETQATEASEGPKPLAPNGLFLGANPGEQLAQAICAAGTDTLPMDAEIGRSVVTAQQVELTLAELAKNPPIPVDLARITRVFSTKLQFVEFTVKRAKLSRTQLTMSNKHLNADVQGELQGLIESKLRAFGDFRDEEVEVPGFSNGEAVFDRSGSPLTEKVSEASLERQRNAFERRFIFNIAGFGRLIAKDDKIDFEKQTKAYEEQLKAHSKALRNRIDAQADKIIGEALALIIDRGKRTGIKLDAALLRGELKKGLSRTKDETPEVKLVFKDVTYEQTRNPEFREKIDRVLPSNKRKQLGAWNSVFDAAKAAPTKPQ